MQEHRALQANGGAGGKAGRASLASRLVTYQAERFPLLSLFPAISVFFFAVSLTSQALVSPFVRIGWGDLGVWLTFLLVFFHLRLMDEFKDAKVDARFRRERPVPRGLVTLAELRRLGIAVVVLEVAINALIGPETLALYALVLAFSALMYAEFFVGSWLRRRFTIYSASHMLLVVLLVVYAAGSTALRSGTPPAPELGLGAVLAYAVGSLVEVGRKTRAPEDEISGLESFSARYGAAGVAGLLVALIGVATAAAAALSLAVDTAPAAIVALTVAALLAGIAVLRYARRPDTRNARLVDRVVAPGILLACYGTLTLQVLLQRQVVVGL